MSYLGGTRAGRTVTPRVFSLRPQDQQVLPGPCIMDADNSYDGGNTSYEWEIRGGWILAQITSSKMWVPCKRTTITTGGSGSGSGAGSATIAVVNAAAFKSGETITIVTQNVGTITRTISSIDYTLNTITVSGAVFQVATGAVVTADPGGTLAGAEIPRGILKETTFLRNLQDPIDAAAGTAYDRAIQVVYRDYVDEDKILGDYAACRDATVNYLSGILWDDRQQGG